MVPLPRKNPFVSVVIPTLNPGGALPELLAALGAQTLKPAEVVVVDSLSDDGTADLARRHGCVVVEVRQAEFDHGGTRNRGARAARGEVLVFMTQDAVPVHEEALAQLVAALERPDVAAAYGRHVPHAHAPPIDRFARLFNYPPGDVLVKSRADVRRLGIKAFFFSDVFSAVRRREFEAVGGFPNQIVTGEDMVLAARLMSAGWKVAYVPEAAVYHSHAYTPWRQFQRYFDIGAAHAEFEWILEQAPPEGEGRRYVVCLLRYLLAERLYAWLPLAVVDTAARWLGYRLGRRSRLLPGRLRYLLGMNKAYWRRQLDQRVDGGDAR
jgi:rhamnosyltransferase